MRVLVADDDAGVRMVARAVVQKQGHECFEAANGDAAWAMFQQHQPHVLITDRLMPPGMDGLQLCRAIRRSERDEYTYIVLLTSLASHHEVLGGIEAGADDYVIKPLDPFALLTRLLVADRVTSLHRDLAQYRAKLAIQAQTDPLTGLYNRLRLAADIERLHERSVRYRRGYSLALCDIDLFKRYNDTQGHQAGDKALQAVGSAVAAFGRQDDSSYRYGGEEFLLLLPEQPFAAAAAAMERLRAGVEALSIQHPVSPVGVLTMSIGVSSFVPGHAADSKEVLRQADLALYEAKAAGRNLVAVRHDPDHLPEGAADFATLVEAGHR
jgi:two-component system chemotaxis response regulator CheY